MQVFVYQNSHFIRYPFWARNKWRLIQYVNDVFASSQLLNQTGD